MKTITKIVDVVPEPVRIIIGILLALTLALGLRSRMTAARARRLERQRAQLLDDVGLLQAALLPLPPARLGPVSTSVAYRPADGPGAGGDFYDLFALESGQLAVIVGDVSGHGRAALPHTALVRYTVRAYLEAGLAPRDALRTAATVLEHQLGDSFATVVAATYDPRERVLTYASAGHPPPLVLGSQAVKAVTSCSSPPIGAGAPAGTRQSVVHVPGFAKLCFHTDGVTDARVGSDLFGSERLADTLAALAPHADARALLERVAGQADARPDDMAACLLVVDGAGAPPRTIAEQLWLDHEDVASGRAERFLGACGLQPQQIDRTIGAARAGLRQSPSALLEVRFEDGRPRAVLLPDNITAIQAAGATQSKPVAGASL